MHPVIVRLHLVKVQVDLGNELIRVSVDDNGKGFDPETLKEATNLGLKLIRERAEMLGGNFEIDSAAGSGARIFVYCSGESLET